MQFQNVRASSTAIALAAMASSCSFGPVGGGPTSGDAAPSSDALGAIDALGDHERVGAGPLDCSSAVSAATASEAAAITARADAQRTGWYPNQPALSPAIV